jgi:hypothetical protein
MKGAPGQGLDRAVFLGSWGKGSRKWSAFADEKRFIWRLTGYSGGRLRIAFGNRH